MTSTIRAVRSTVEFEDGSTVSLLVNNTGLSGWGTGSATSAQVRIAARLLDPLRKALAPDAEGGNWQNQRSRTIQPAEPIDPMRDGIAPLPVTATRPARTPDASAEVTL